MSAENRRTRKHLTDTLHVKEEKTGLENAATPEENSREISAGGKAATMADSGSTYESILNNADNATGSSEDTRLFPKPSLSYIALIAKVILSSPAKKLNLASIYRAMEERFPHIRTRGPGWRNSVRHNLSVNDCFVKVSRCEDGRGHYWGVHPAHLRDFQQGNFRLLKKARRGRERGRYKEVVGRPAWIDTSYGLSESRALAFAAPQCPLQGLWEYQPYFLDWNQPRFQPWSVRTGCEHSPSWMKHYCCPEMLSASCGWVTAGRGHASRPLTSSLHPGEMNDPAFSGMGDSYDSMFIKPAVQTVCFPGCWCVPPVIKELKLLPYRL